MHIVILVKSMNSKFVNRKDAVMFQKICKLYRTDKD